MISDEDNQAVKCLVTAIVLLPKTYNMSEEESEIFIEVMLDAMARQLKPEFVTMMQEYVLDLALQSQHIDSVEDIMQEINSLKS